MPILDVQIVGPVPEETRTGLAQRIADSAGDVLRSPPQGTWVRLHLISEADYAENGGRTQDTGRPVLVSILRSEMPEHGALAEEVLRLSSAIAEACARPVMNVHLIYEVAGKGRVAFGGRLRM
jgi:phenylpyruvate tautomerase PptA (4-oxalocrotonate tautomerase family)